MINFRETFLYSWKVEYQLCFPRSEQPLLVVELLLLELHGELPPVLRKEHHLEGQHAVSQQGASSGLPGVPVSLPTTTQSR